MINRYRWVARSAKELSLPRLAANQTKAEVAELADAADSKSVVITDLWVRFPPSARNPIQGALSPGRSGEAFEVSLSKADRQDPTLLRLLVADARVGLVRAGGCPLDAFTWQRAIGERIAARSCPEQLRDGVLTLRVASSVWAQELSLLSATIIERLAPFGFVVQKIRCRVGTVEAQPRAKTTRPIVSLPPVELPADLSKQLARITDDDLRASIETAARAQLQLRAKAQKRAASAAKPDARGLRSAGRETVLRDQSAPEPNAGRRRTREPRRD
jgi:hypothetical protein